MTSRDIARAFFEKLCSGDFAGGFASMADGATWSIIGTTAMSKTFDKASMLSELVPMLSTFKEPARMGVDEIIAEGDRAVVLAHVEGVGPYAPYKQATYCFVLRTGNGKVQEIVEYLDTVAVEEAICGRRIVDRAKAEAA
jgi:ketosteroid isomerase-like protein